MYFILGTPFILLYWLCWLAVCGSLTYEMIRAYITDTAPQKHPLVALFVTHRPSRYSYDQTSRLLGYTHEYDMDGFTLFLAVFFGFIIGLIATVLWPIFLFWLILWSARFYNRNREAIDEWRAERAAKKAAHPKAAKPKQEQIQKQKDKPLNLDGI